MPIWGRRVGDEDIVAAQPYDEHLRLVIECVFPSSSELNGGGIAVEADCLSMFSPSILPDNRQGGGIMRASGHGVAEMRLSERVWRKNVDEKVPCH